MKSCYLLFISILYICVCLHMLCIKVYRKTSVGEAQRDIKTEFDRENHEIQKATKQKPCSPKLGLKQPLEQATQPPLWASWPITLPPHLVLHLRSGLSPIHSIFICFTFRFEPN